MPNGEIKREVLESDPMLLYATILAQPGYKQRPATFRGDCEFMTTEFTHRGCVICAVLVHQLKQAFLVSLSPGEGRELVEKLTGVLASQWPSKPAPKAG